MNKLLNEFLKFIQLYAVNHTGYSKDDIANAAASHFGLIKERKVFHYPEFAIRFSSAKGTKGSLFSNTVLSLSTLKKYDQIPFIICVLRSDGIEFLLANTTFLKKISHSSQKLRIDNVKGSFNGSDIIRTFDNIANIPENFEKLFLIHTEFSWRENLERLVERTNAIVPTGVRFEPSKKQVQKILKSPKIANLLSSHPEYIKLYDEFNGLVRTNEDAILKAAKIENINQRGNKIEQIITQTGNFHSLEDVTRTLAFGPEVKIDIKTKILTLASSPKAYNIDKVLKELATGNTVFSFFFIGIDVEANTIKTCLVSIFDQTILGATREQFHWAGRNSRGHTQLTGDFSSIFDSGFSEDIDTFAAEKYLKKLVDLKPPVLKNNRNRNQ